VTNVEDRVERALHVLAEGIEPDLAAARQRFGAPSGSAVRRERRVLRPRRWVTLAATTVVVVGVGSLWAVGNRTEQPTDGTDPAASPPGPTARPPTTVGTAPTTTVGIEPPLVPAPERLAVLDPQPGVAPIRSDPVLDWVHGTTSSAPRRWFIRRSADGVPIGGVSVSDTVASEWTRIFGDAPSADIEGVDARLVVAPPTVEVGWLTEDGARIVTGSGDVDVEETVAIARLTVPADGLGDIPVPDGFEEVAVPTYDASVRYEDTQVTIGLGTVAPDENVDVAAVAFMTPGRDGPLSPLPGEDGWVTTTFGGHPTVVAAVAPDAVATVVGLPGTDVASLVPALSVVPGRQVTVANPEATHGIPADAKKTYGEIDRGRWVVYEYSTIHAPDCFSIDASWGGSGDCSPPGKSDCPVANPTGGPTQPPGFEVFVPYLVDDLEVALDGVAAAEMTVEHAQGFTFAYGPAPVADPDIEVTVNGGPAC
jgi:hypothetical protein